MLLLGAGLLLAAQILGIIGLVRRGYELLVAIGMVVLVVPPLALVVGLALTV